MKDFAGSLGLQIPRTGAVVSHAGVALLRVLADNTGLTAGCRRRWPSRRLLVHDRGRVMAELACSIADGAKVVGVFHAIGD